jgi:hypothetical protein
MAEGLRHPTVGPMCQGRSKCGPVAPVEEWATRWHCLVAVSIVEPSSPCLLRIRMWPSTEAGDTTPADMDDREQIAKAAFTG